MKTRAQITVTGRISEAEALWYDTSRWATFVDGFHHVVRADPGWPAEGELVWDSMPGGRARVIEIVQRYEPRVGQTISVEDEKSTGTQSIAFTARPGDRLQITLELNYVLKDKPVGPLSVVVDAIFIRPRQREALQRTLARFSRELASERRAGG
ncbi:MAG: hypothetical protein QOF12_2614 [Solirubrobacteraceae bacterium]|nr:hypothetical protein [Solirubrobacteraceae bacterium]